MGMLAGLALAGMVTEWQKESVPTLATRAKAAAIPAQVSPKMSTPAPVSPKTRGVGAEGTLGVGGARQGGTNSTRPSALGAGGRVWPLVFFIGVLHPTPHTLNPQP